MNICTKLYTKYKEIFLYLVFGVLTTVINIVSFWLLNDILKIEYKISNVIAWILAVIFAFLTNKTIVFESKNKNKEEITKEVITFFIARLFSLVVDMVIMILMIDIININSLVAKIISNVVVVVINYIFSKFIIFRK